MPSKAWTALLPSIFFIPWLTRRRTELLDWGLAQADALAILPQVDQSENPTLARCDLAQSVLSRLLFPFKRLTGSLFKNAQLSMNEPTPSISGPPFFLLFALFPFLSFSPLPDCDCRTDRHMLLSFFLLPCPFTPPPPFIAVHSMDLSSNSSGHVINHCTNKIC